MSGAAPTSSRSDGLENLAVRQLRRITHLVTVGDLDDLAELHAEAVVTEDRQLGLRTITEGRAAHHLAGRALHETLHGAEWRVPEVLATRGDRLCVARYETAGRFTVGYYTVLEVDPEGRVRRGVVFDLDNLLDALDLLDEWYSEGDGRAWAEVLGITRQSGRSIAAGDAVGLAEVLADDFVTVDHRPLGWGRRDRADLLAAVAARPTTFGSGVSIVPSVLRLDPVGTLGTYEIRARTAEGFESLEVGLALSLVRDGKLLRLETFAEDAVVDAETSFDGLLT